MVQKLVKNRRWIKLLLMTCFCAWFTGCFGGRETDEVAIVLAVGIDKGKNAPIQMTITLANPRNFATGGGQGGGGGEGQQEAFITTSIEGPSIWECYLLFNSHGTRQMSFQHTRAYLFGEEIARQGIEKYLVALLRNREVRRNSSLIICQGSAKEFMEKNKPKLESSPAKQFQFMDQMSDITGFFPNGDIHRFYTTLKSLHSSPTTGMVAISQGREASEKAVQPLKIPYKAGEVPQSKGSNAAQFIGAAIFRDDRMVDKITGDETRTMMLLQDQFQLSTFTMRDPNPQYKNNVITLRLRRAKPSKVQLTQTEDQLKIHQTIFLEGEFWSIQSGENYEKPDKKKIVEEAFDRQMEKLAQGLIDKTKEKDYGDIFHYDRHYRKTLHSWEDWYNLRWKEIYDQAEITVDFKTNIRRTGLLRKTEAFPRE